jgi:hypothetical protein
MKLMQLQKYSLNVRYKRGRQMYLADTLRRAYQLGEQSMAEVKKLEYVSHTESLALAPDNLQHLQHAAAQDVAMHELRQVILQGWPGHRAEVPDAARPYFDFRDQMTLRDRLIFKVSVVVIPAALCSEVMAKCHATHIGIEGCLQRARSQCTGHECHPI